MTRKIAKSHTLYYTWRCTYLFIPSMSLYSPWINNAQFSAADQPGSLLIHPLIAAHRHTDRLACFPPHACPNPLHYIQHTLYVPYIYIYWLAERASEWGINEQFSWLFRPPLIFLPPDKSTKRFSHVRTSLLITLRMSMIRCVRVFAGGNQRNPSWAKSRIKRLLTLFFCLIRGVFNV